MTFSTMMILVFGVVGIDGAAVNSSRSPGCTPNPTHYGPTSNVGGCCRPDEHETWYYDFPDHFCAHTCNTDNDCPTDVPEMSNVKPWCGKYIGDPWAICYGGCKEDTDCGVGAHCIQGLGSSWPFFCTYNPKINCYYIEAVTGHWEQISSSPFKQDVKISVGVTHSSSQTITSEWGVKVTETAKAGFKAFGADVETSVTGEISASISAEYSSTFSMTSTKEYDYEFPGGVVWQWNFGVKTGCGIFTVEGHNLQYTVNAVRSPCCLPGYFANDTQPLGSCIGGSPSLCNLTVVEA